MDAERIMERVRRLLAIANDPAASDNEQRIALEQAQRLMDRHAIEEWQLEEDHDAIEIIRRMIHLEANPCNWYMAELANIVALGNRCRASYGRRHGLVRLGLHPGPHGDHAEDQADGTRNTLEDEADRLAQPQDGRRRPALVVVGGHGRTRRQTTAVIPAGPSRLHRNNERIIGDITITITRKETQQNVLGTLYRPSQSAPHRTA